MSLFDPSQTAKSPAVYHRQMSAFGLCPHTLLGSIASSSRFAAWPAGWETPRRYQTDQKGGERCPMVVITWSEKMKCSAGSQTVMSPTSKSVPVHALISSGVSPSHTSIRVRPFVLSTSNTAWQTETGQKDREGGRKRKKKRMRCLEREMGVGDETQRQNSESISLIDGFEPYDVWSLGSQTRVRGPQLLK